MSALIPIKSFLGKYYTEILYSVQQDKYKDTGLARFLDQKFVIQDNKVQMVVDPSLAGMVMTVSGNDIYISKDFYDHPNIVITNSMENENTQTLNPKANYNPAIFQSLAYLICQNHVTINIIGEIDEPIYIKYTSPYEAFYSSVVNIDINQEVSVEIVEEFESHCAVNAVIDYTLHAFSGLKLTTIYNNNMTSMSYVYRNVFTREQSEYTHIVLGKGSADVIDETKIKCMSGSKSELLGVIDSAGKNFHSILYVDSVVPDYHISVSYRDVLYGKSSVTFFPVLLGQAAMSGGSTIEVSNIKLDDIPEASRKEELKKYIAPIFDRAILERTMGVKRFYDNKLLFLQNYK